MLINKGGFNYPSFMGITIINIYIYFYYHNGGILKIIIDDSYKYINHNGD